MKNRSAMNSPDGLIVFGLPIQTLGLYTLSGLLTAGALVTLGLGLFSEILVAGPRALVEAPTTTGQETVFYTAQPGSLQSTGLRVLWSLGTAMGIAGFAALVAIVGRISSRDPIFGEANTTLGTLGGSFALFVLFGGFAIRNVTSGRILDSAGIAATTESEDFALWFLDLPFIAIFVSFMAIGHIWSRASKLHDFQSETI